MKSRYSIVIRWNKEKRAFVALLPEFGRECLPGETYEEALANAETTLKRVLLEHEVQERPLPAPFQIPEGSPTLLAHPENKALSVFVVVFLLVLTGIFTAFTLLFINACRTYGDGPSLKGLWVLVALMAGIALLTFGYAIRALKEFIQARRAVKSAREEEPS